MMHLLATQHMIVDAEQGIGEPHGEAFQYFCEERILVFTPPRGGKEVRTVTLAVAVGHDVVAGVEETMVEQRYLALSIDEVRLVVYAAERVFRPESLEEHHGQVMDVERAIGLDEMAVGIGIEHILDELRALLASDDGWLESPHEVLADKIRQVQQVVKRLIHHHIRVEIDAAIVVESVKPDVVGGKGVLALGEGLARPWCGMDVEPLRVPKHDLVVGQHAVP